MWDKERFHTLQSASASRYSCVTTTGIRSGSSSGGATSAGVFPSARPFFIPASGRRRVANVVERILIEHLKVRELAPLDQTDILPHPRCLGAEIVPTRKTSWFDYAAAPIPGLPVHAKPCISPWPPSPHDLRRQRSSPLAPRLD
jgi:hypothetical protein